MTLAAHDRSPETGSPRADGSHSVLFYKDDRGLSASVATFVKAGLDARQPIVVIATAEHQEAFRRALAMATGTGAGAPRDGDVEWIDARAMLSQIVAGDVPDVGRFSAAVAPMLERLTARGGPTRLRAYGEMVDLLCRAGRPEWAIAIEQMWNDVAARHAMDLYCAYGIDHVCRDPLVHERVCDAHDRFSATEDAADPHTRLRALTELRRRATRLEAEIEAANRVKDEVLANISHELRTPLNAILGWARLLASRSTDPYTTRAAGTIVRNAESQARIIEDLVDVSRIIGGAMRIEPRAGDLGPIVREAVEALRPSATARGLAIDVVGADQRLPAVIDASRMQQVMWNLLSNAVKFTDRGSVRVLAEKSDGTIRVSVLDTGRGIDPAFVPFVFDRFRQAESSPARRSGGLGLGLAIVRRLVELHGGTISVESEGIGKGTTFVLALPAEENPDAPNGDRNSPTTPQESSLRGISILVVDDDLDAREVVAELLVSLGALVTTSGSAQEARARIASSRPDVIISDIGMPGEDGYSFARTVRALPPDRGGATPIIAVTGYAGPHDRMRAIAAGFDNHIAKPMDPEELAQAIRDAA